MGIPIRHRSDHSMVYIPASDDAWDHERIARELAAISGDTKVVQIIADGDAAKEILPWTSPDEHPVRRYAMGRSRFDLSTVREYLLPDVKPAEFKLRRAPVAGYEEIQEELGKGKIPKAGRVAMSYSLAQVDVEGLDIDLRRSTGGALLTEVLDELRQRLGDHEYQMLGFACINANAALMDDEKKA